jgi:DNA (cytosine-5)-methyltransferase 1
MKGVPAWKADFLSKNFELYQSLLEESDAPWIRAWLRSVREFPESRRKLEWQAQDTEKLSDCVVSLRPSGIRAKRATHLPSLVAIAQTPLLVPHKRKLSPREAARLQGLPDGFDFGDQRVGLTFKQLGNGVNVGVVWNVLKAHVERDAELLEATDAGRRILKAVRDSASDPRADVRLALESAQGRVRSQGEVEAEV